MPKISVLDYGSRKIVKTIESDDWDGLMQRAKKEGGLASSIYDNPYWPSYPKDANSLEESMARHWVDGYVERIANA